MRPQSLVPFLITSFVIHAIVASVLGHYKEPTRQLMELVEMQFGDPNAQNGKLNLDSQAGSSASTKNLESQSFAAAPPKIQADLRPTTLPTPAASDSPVLAKAETAQASGMASEIKVSAPAVKVPSKVSKPKKTAAKKPRPVKKLPEKVQTFEEDTDDLEYVPLNAEAGLDQAADSQTEQDIWQWNDQGEESIHSKLPPAAQVLAKEPKETRVKPNSESLSAQRPAPIPSRQTPRDADKPSIEELNQMNQNQSDDIIEEPMGGLSSQNQKGSSSSGAAPLSFGDPEGVRDVRDLMQVAGNPKPSYSRDERYKGFEGEVVFLGYVNGNGTLGRLKKVRSSGHESLDSKSYRAVQRWRFYPGQEGWVRIPFVWTLSGPNVQVAAQ